MLEISGFRAWQGRGGDWGGLGGLGRRRLLNEAQAYHGPLDLDILSAILSSEK